MSKKEATTEVVVTVETAKDVMATELNNADWGSVDVGSDDLVLPKLLLMQGLSEMVTQGNAKMGDIINSLTNTVVADEKKPLRILPLFCRKSWVIEKYDGSKFQFEKIIPDIGEKLPFNEEINGVKYKNSHQYEFFVLTEDRSIPHILSFRGTSHKAGKQLFTQMYVMNKALGKNPSAYWIDLGCIRDKNDKGVYMVWTFKPAELSKVEDQQEALKWIPIVNSINTRPEVQHEAKESTVF